MIITDAVKFLNPYLKNKLSTTNAQFLSLFLYPTHQRTHLPLQKSLKRGWENVVMRILGPHTWGCPTSLPSLVMQVHSTWEKNL